MPHDSAIPRRDFLKALGLGTVALAGTTLVGCSAQEGVTADQNAVGRTDIAGAADVSFSQSVDVLIVGSGIAGLSAAMDPLEAGLSVHVAEKQSLLGGESYLSNGVFYVVGTTLQETAGIGVSPEDTWAGRLAAEGSAWDEARAAYQKKLFDLAPAWIDRAQADYNAVFADPAAYRGTTTDIVLPKNGLGDMTSVMTPLRDALVGKGLTTTTGIRATAFILDEDGKVVGMRFRAEESNHVVDIQARAVVVATGGFAGNQEMMTLNVPAQAEAGCLASCGHSMGEGQDLCLGIGGALADMELEDNLIADIPNASAWGAFAPVLQLSPAGRRFAPEDDRFAAANRCFSDGLGYWWLVFDNQLLASTQATNVARVRQEHTDRILGPFDDAAGLADALGIPQETLDGTLSDYDSLVKNGTDTAEGKTHFLSSLAAPYYAVKLFPRRYRTRGGAAVDEAGRLTLASDGSALENVFCCGAAAIGTHDGLSACAASGLLVGQSIVEAFANTKETAADESAAE